MPRRHNRAFTQTGTAPGSRSNWRIEETSTLVALPVCSILTLGLYFSTF